MNTTINYDQTTIKTSNSSTEMNVSTESSGESYYLNSFYNKAYTVKQFFQIF